MAEARRAREGIAGDEVQEVNEICFGKVPETIARSWAFTLSENHCSF